VRTISPEKTHIEYFQSISDAHGVLSTVFGIRVKADSCLAVVKTVGGLSNCSGKEFGIPLRPETLPSHLRILVENHMLNFPASDLINVLTGKTSFQQALEAPLRIEPQRAATNGTEQLPNHSEQLFKLKSIA
jgi:hypothetical protein